MEKKLSWKVISNYLDKELVKSKHILTFGTLGSLDITNDVDVVITKKPSSPSADFFMEIHTLFEKLDEFLNRNYKTRAVRFAQATQEYLVDYFTSKKIMFHTMLYVSYSEMKRDWNWALFKGENLRKILETNYTCILGNKSSLFSKDFKKENYYENIFIYLYLYDSLNSNLPKEVMLKTMNGCFKYLYKKRLGLENPTAKSREEAKKYFYELCNILDRLNKEKGFKVNNTKEGWEVKKAQ